MLEKVAVSPRGLVGSLGAARTDLLVSSLLGPEVAQYSPGLGVVVVGLAVVVQEFFCQLIILFFLVLVLMLMLVLVLVLVLKFLLRARGLWVVLGQLLTPWSEAPQVWDGQLMVLKAVVVFTVVVPTLPTDGFESYELGSQ